MLGTKEMRLDGRGMPHPQQRFVLGRDIHDSELQNPTPKKMKASYENYEDIISELGTVFTTVTKTVTDKTIIAEENNTILREKETVCISATDKENILSAVQQMSRKELEELILVKIVEVLVKESEAGKFRSQVAQLQKHKDKLQEQISNLCKQVIKMGTAIRLICDKAEFAAKHNKLPTPVILYRSVGLQVNTSSGNGTGVAKPVVNKGPENGFKIPPIPKHIPVANILRRTPVQIRPQFKAPTSVVPIPKSNLEPVSASSSVNKVLTKPIEKLNKNSRTPVPVNASSQEEGLQNELSEIIELPPFPPPKPAVRTPNGLPPKPLLTLTEGKGQDIILNWTLEREQKHPAIVSYQIYSFGSHTEIKWKLVGKTAALELPMACTLSRFNQGSSYVFIVRAVDSFGQTGPFCEPRRVFLRKTN